MLRMHSVATNRRMSRTPGSHNRVTRNASTTRCTYHARKHAMRRHSGRMNVCAEPAASIVASITQHSFTAQTAHRGGQAPLLFAHHLRMQYVPTQSRHTVPGSFALGMSIPLWQIWQGGPIVVHSKTF